MNLINLLYRGSCVLAFTCVVMVVLPGCSKDWLSAKPVKNQDIPSKLSDYKAMLNHTGSLNANNMSLGEVASDGHYVTESVWAGTKDIAPTNAYTWSQHSIYPTSESYTSTYYRVYQCNLILEGLAELKVSSEQERKELAGLKARALFVKAMTYYWLSQIYAQPYRAVSAATDQGILIQANSSFLDNVKRITVAETYDLILGYVLEALPNLPVKPEHVTQASQPAAYALLARLYLCMQNYEEALKNANSCLDLRSTLLDYNNVALPAYYLGAFNAEVLYHEEMSNSEINGFTTGSALIEADLYNSFEENDLRKSLFFSVFNGNATFKGNYNNSTFQLFCGLAADEVYLIRAECNARKGNTAAAMTDLNILLRNRYKKNTDGTSTYIDQSAADGNAALTLILQERRKELMQRGLRWADLRRLNIDPATAVTLSRTIGGNTYTLAPNSYQYTFPLPENVLTLSGQPQTTGWDK